MTYGELSLIQAFLCGLFEEKKLEVSELQKQVEKDPACEPKLAYAMGQYYRLKSLKETISHDLTSLQGVGPGDLFCRGTPKSANFRAVEGIAEELSKINDTLSHIVTYG